MRAPVLLVLALLAPAAAARAATVELRPGGVIDEEKVDLLEVAAAPGETNALNVTITRVGADEQGSPSLAMVHDDGATLTVTGGCTAIDAHTVQCQTPNELGEVDVTLGDGDDAATMRSVSKDQFIYNTVIDGGEGDDIVATGDGGELKGGPGRDRLVGSSAYESMDGGPGDDELSGGGAGDFLAGGPGDDVLHGGAGNDTIVGGGGALETSPAGSDQLYGEDGIDSLDDGDSDSQPAAVGADLVDGGTGEDEVNSYLRRSEPVTVDLGSQAPAGQPGENDTLRGIEEAFGGAGDDTLIGNDSDNFLDGRDGDDQVRGGGGDDLIFADDRDSVAGEAGDDDIRTVPEFTGSPRCGAGDDVVRIDVFLRKPSNLRGPYIERACERLTSGTGFALDPVPVVGSRQRLWFSVAKFRCCRLSLTVSWPGGSFGRLGSAGIRGTRVPVRVPRLVAGRITRPGIVLRAVVAPLGAAPFVWRFYAHSVKEGTS